MTLLARRAVVASDDSKVTQSHPLFRSFIKASLERREAKKVEAARARAGAVRQG
jgi:hypothetical protein